MVAGIILHIGIHKTGTTAIQKGLNEARDELLHHAVGYPKAGLWLDAHHGLAFALQDPPKALPTGLSAASYLATLWDELDAMKCPRAIISSEDLWPLPARRIVEVLPAPIDKVVIYLRRQDNWLDSMYREMIKSSNFRGSPEAFVRAVMRRERFEYYSAPIDPDFHRLIQDWMSVLTYDKLQLRVYEPSAARADAVADFTSAIGLDGLRLADKPALHNRSHAAELTALLAFADERLSDEARRLLRASAWWTNEHLRSQHASSILSDGLRREILDHYRAGNAEVARMVGRPDGALFVEPEPDGTGLGFEADTSALCGVLAAVVASQTDRLNYQQALISRLEQRVAELQST